MGHGFAIIFSRHLTEDEQKIVRDSIGLEHPITLLHADDPATEFVMEVTGSAEGDRTLLLTLEACEHFAKRAGDLCDSGEWPAELAKALLTADVMRNPEPRPRRRRAKVRGGRPRMSAVAKRNKMVLNAASALLRDKGVVISRDEMAATLEASAQQLAYLQGRLEERERRSGESTKTLQMIMEAMPQFITLFDAMKSGGGPTFDPTKTPGFPSVDDFRGPDMERALAMDTPPPTVKGQDYGVVSVKVQNACEALGIVTALDWLRMRDNLDVEMFRHADERPMFREGGKARGQMDAFVQGWFDGKVE
jgi:hypothetical protein